MRRLEERTAPDALGVWFADASASPSHDHAHDHDHADHFDQESPEVHAPCGTADPEDADTAVAVLFPDLAASTAAVTSVPEFEIISDDDAADRHQHLALGPPPLQVDAAALPGLRGELQDPAPRDALPAAGASGSPETRTDTDTNAGLPNHTDPKPPFGVSKKCSTASGAPARELCGPETSPSALVQGTVDLRDED